MICAPSPARRKIEGVYSSARHARRAVPCAPRRLHPRARGKSLRQAMRAGLDKLVDEIRCLPRLRHARMRQDRWFGCIPKRAF